jgi:hypothetical protein
MDKCWSRGVVLISPRHNHSTTFRDAHGPVPVNPVRIRTVAPPIEEEDIDNPWAGPMNA